MKNNQTAIYVANLGAYNAGRLVGKWLTLPMETEELEGELEKIGKAYNFEGDYELAIHDTDGMPFGVSEYDDILEINRKMEMLDNLDLDEGIITAILDYCSDVDDALDILEKRDFHIYEGCKDMTDVAYQVVEECYTLQEPLATYFDYVAFGRDLSYEGNYISYEGGMLEVLY